MASRPHLSKSKYIAGCQCARRVWLACREPSLASEASPAQQALFDTGSQVGVRAHALFPGGVAVEEPAWKHAEAVARTAKLMADEGVPAIFEAAFEHRGVRIRVDVLERLRPDRWGLREVKAATTRKDVHLDDVAVQRFVLDGSGVRIPSVELMLVDREFVRGEGEIDWPRFFKRIEVTDDVDAVLAEVPGRVAAMHEILEEAAAPEVEPDGHCFYPYDCEYWAACTRAKPADWIYNLPSLTGERLDQLRASGIERIGEIPSDVQLTELQARARDAVRSGEVGVAPGLAEALGAAGPPAFYLDFETLNAAIPLWPGTRPYDQIPFQWSLHHVDAQGALSHREFLAAGRGDPRRELAEALLEALGNDGPPVLVYSAFESGVLRALADALPDRAAPLESVRARLVDLLPIVRAHVYHRDFGRSFSLKSVAPALVPGFGYADLDGVAVGGEASAAFAKIAAGLVERGGEQRLRAQLLAYCQRDTLALVEVHRSLISLARGDRP